MSRSQTRKNPLPDSLVVAVEAQQLAAVVQWWDSLSQTQQQDLLDDVSDQPETIATLTDIECSSDDEQQNDWFEYVVNQDMRFFFDRNNGCQTSHGYIVYPMLSAISAATDGEVLAQILRRKGST